MSVDSADTVRVKHFVKIALSRSMSKINTFLHFTQKFKMATKSDKKMFLRLRHKFKMAAKSGGKMIFGKSRQ